VQLGETLTLIVKTIDWVGKPCCFGYVIVDTSFNLESTIISPPIQRFITFRYHYHWSQRNLLVLLSSLTDVLLTPLIPTIILRLRQRDPIHNAWLRGWHVLDSYIGGGGHHILIDGSGFNELVVALDILKGFQIEGIFGHPNSIGENASFLNPRVGVRRFIGLTSKGLCQCMV
jgi:hypothetical protein